MKVTEKEFEDLQKIKKLLIDIEKIYSGLSDELKKDFCKMSIDGYSMDDWINWSIIAYEEFFGEDVLEIRN